MSLICALSSCFAGTFFVAYRVMLRRENTRRTQRHRDLLIRAMEIVPETSAR